MPKKSDEAVRPRSRKDTTTIEVGRDIQREFKVAAVHLNVTLRDLVEEALTAYRPQIEKKLTRKTA